jgi:hypothetical protein
MIWTRRQFLETVSIPAWAACGWPREGGVNLVDATAALDAASARYGAFPLGDAIARFRDDQARRAGAWTSTGLGRGEYLRLMHGIVRSFSDYQDARGAIVDPYEQKERQYSTPAFALAAAVLCASGRDTALLPAAVRAMEAACADLADGKAADGHADFFTVLLMHADRVFRGVVPESAATPWRRNLTRVDPERIYRRQPTAPSINNWNLVAAAGESLRTRDGYGTSTAWIEASLTRQLDLFTPWGMYRDPNDPMAYDHFARLWVLDLLDGGYTGPSAAILEALVERGAWASLFMQSPWGELPCGGRSAHHQWNEAEQAVTFESMASRYARRGDHAAAGAFKRAAHLSVQSIGRWVRPSGELWVVKNRMDPRLRHGYESYSFHSQYNLLTAAMLAIAWMRADDAIAERPCPAETGGFGFVLQPAFHKVIANVGGTYVEIDTGADLHYNPTGILRLHHRAVPPETLSDGVSSRADYTLPTKSSRSLALGPEWRDRAGQSHALADHGGTDLDPVEFRLVAASASRVEMELVYRGRLRGGASAVREHVRMSRGVVEIEHRVDGEVDAVRQYWPVLLTDGTAASTITVHGRSAAVSREGGQFQFEALTGTASVARLGAAEPCRNGSMDACVTETAGRVIRSRVSAGRGAA